MFGAYIFTRTYILSLIQLLKWCNVPKDQEFFYVSRLQSTPFLIRIATRREFELPWQVISCAPHSFLRWVSAATVEFKIDSFLNDLNIPTLSEEQKNSCEGKISSEECFRILENFSRQQNSSEWWNSNRILQKILAFNQRLLY